MVFYMLLVAGHVEYLNRVVNGVSGHQEVHDDEKIFRERKAIFIKSEDVDN